MLIIIHACSTNASFILRVDSIIYIQAQEPSHFELRATPPSILSHSDVKHRASTNKPYHTSTANIAGHKRIKSGNAENKHTCMSGCDQTADPNTIPYSTRTQRYNEVQLRLGSINSHKIRTFSNII
jgi:hypothetical protein